MHSFGVVHMDARDHKSFVDDLNYTFKYISMYIIYIFICISTGYKLSDAGYDVWMGNLRGTIYSSRHKNYSTTQPEFWNYR